MKEKILEVLNDYELWLKDKERFDYVAGLIEHRVMEGKADKTSGEKISEFIPDGIEYSEFAHLSTDRPDEVTRDGDGKLLSDDIKPGQRRVKSYGIFKNEYYDD